MLDEMLDPGIAEQLRRRRWDVEAIADRPELRGRADEDVVEALERTGHALVTDNVVDFAPLHRTLLAAGRHHAGLVFGKMPRSRATVGLWVTALESTLLELGPEGDLRDRYWWLSEERPSR